MPLFQVRDMRTGKPGSHTTVLHATMASGNVKTRRAAASTRPWKRGDARDRLALDPMGGDPRRGVAMFRWWAARASIRRGKTWAREWQ